MLSFKSLIKLRVWVNVKAVENSTVSEVVIESVAALVPESVFASEFGLKSVNIKRYGTLTWKGCCSRIYHLAYWWKPSNKIPPR